MRDARVKELEQKNTELEARLAIVEQASLVVDGQTQNGKEALIPEVRITRYQLQLQQNNASIR